MPQAELREFKVRFTSITHIGDRMVCSGKVIEKFERNGETLARVELKAANQDGAVKLMGEAVVACCGAGCPA
jgi:acyl dehydratase